MPFDFWIDPFWWKIVLLLCGDVAKQLVLLICGDVAKQLYDEVFYKWSRKM